MTTVFYSWQADTPTDVGRNFVEVALERAAARIGKDTTVLEAIRDVTVDKDTEGVGGSPPIVETIFGKIDQSAVFVADVTFVGTRIDGRPSPNPNVLIEYGWALSALTYNRVIAVMNTAFGEPTSETLPFDMRHLRWPIRYNCPADADPETRRAVKEELSKKLEQALRAILLSGEYLASIDQPKSPPLFVERSGVAHSPGRFAHDDETIGIAERYFETPQLVKLSPGPACWLRLMPKYDPQKKWSIDIIRAEAIHGTILRPISRGWMGLSFMRSPDGFGIYPALEKNSDLTLAVVVAFNTGEIWSTDVHLLAATSARNYVPLSEDEYCDSLKEYANLLVRLGIDPPFRWIAGMENLKGRGMYVPARPGHISVAQGPQGHSLEDVVIVEGLYTPGENARLALKPFFERLYEVCCRSRPAHLDDGAG
jgi:hypothetical protein